MHGIAGVEQLIHNQQHLHTLAAQQTPRMVGLVKLDFFFFLIQSWVRQIDAAAFHYVQPRRPDASNSMPCHPRHCPALHRKFSISRAPRCSPAHGRAAVRSGSPAVTCCAQRCALRGQMRGAARRPQTDQINHLCDKIKKKRGYDFYR